MQRGVTMQSASAIATELQSFPSSRWHDDDTDADLMTGLEYYDSGDWGRAKAPLSAAAHRGNITAVFKLANCISNLGDDAAAIPLWRIASDQGHTGARNNLAIRLLKQGRRDEAIALYRLAAEAGDESAMFNLAIQLEDDDRDACYMWLQRAADAGHPRAWTVMGHRRILDGQPDKGWRCLEQGASLGNLSACLTAASLLFDQERFTEAESWLARGFDMADDPNEQHQVPRLWGLMGSTLSVLRRYEEAIPYFERALELGEASVEPALAEARGLLAELPPVESPLTKTSKVEWKDAALGRSPADNSATSWAPPPGKAAYCTQCGSPRQPNAKFCSDCGTALA